MKKSICHRLKTRTLYANCRIGWALTGHSYRKTLRYVAKQYRKKLRRRLKLGR